jgi:hypothetical protein
LLGGEFGETTFNDIRFAPDFFPTIKTIITWFDRTKRIGGAKQYRGTKTEINQGAHGGYCCCVYFLERRSRPEVDMLDTFEYCSLLQPICQNQCDAAHHINFDKSA